MRRFLDATGDAIVLGMLFLKRELCRNDAENFLKCLPTGEEFKVFQVTLLAKFVLEITDYSLSSFPLKFQA